MKKRISRISALLLSLTMLGSMLPGMPVYAAEKVKNTAISTTQSGHDFVVADEGKVATIWVDTNEERPVLRVAEDLQNDILQISGQEPSISNEQAMPEGPVIIVGTLGKSSKIQDLIDENKITSQEVSAIEGAWEAYLIKVIDENTMVIAGSDNRGAIYGVYEISEQMGVSPWHYFGDVPVQKKTNVYIPSGTLLTDQPDVQYRGLFINDEEKLYQWVCKYLDSEGKKVFGPEFYEKLYELILRLGGNYFWPAMHMVGFNNTPENIATLQEYGVVFGTSHCDMLGRTNKHEWNGWCKDKGYNLTLKDWDYTVHKDKMIEYWTEGVERHKNSDVQWTVGLRGNSDEPMIAKNLAAYMLEGENPEDEQVIEDAKTRVLIDAMKEQYKILQEVLGAEKAEKAFKVFVPYKEVLPLYQNEIFQQFLESEECFDFTTMWCNDNHGMVRNLPNAEERVREGGNALYYHLSYWAPKDQSYMWMSSMPLSIMGEELNKSWEAGIQKAWIVNVGDIKPAEGELDYFMRCGWDIDYTTNSIDYSTEWMIRNFGNQMSVETADEVANVLNEFYHHSNVRKIEQMRLDLFDQMNFNEWDKRMNASHELYLKIAEIANGFTDQAVKDAFYELVQCKVNWTYFTNRMFYYADKSNLAYDQGKMASADVYSQLSMDADAARKEEIAAYGQLANGKWEGFIDPENYDVGSNFAGAPVTSQSPATSPAMKLGDTKMGVIVQGEAMPTEETSTITFSRYNQDGKFMDIFNKGAGSFAWTASSDAQWLTLSATEGTVCDEERVWITVNDYDAAANQTATITITDEATTKLVQVSVQEVQAGIENCYVEADGYVSMQAEHYSSKVDVEGKTWQLMENAGRGFDGDMMRSFDKNFGEIAEDSIAGNSPYLSYDFYLTSEGTFDMEVYRLPTLNATGAVRFAVSVDDRPESFKVVSSMATDEGTSEAQNPQWAENLYHQIEKHIVQLPELGAGKHTLKIWMVDNFISIDKVVIYTNGIPKSELGPDESYHSSYNPNFTNFVPTLSRADAEVTRKDLTSEWGSGNYVEAGGKVYIEAEHAMENVLTSSNDVTTEILNAGAYTVTHNDLALPEGLSHNAWRFTQSDTGYGVYSPDLGKEWPTNDATMQEYGFRTHSPELAYRINFTTPGWYYVWARVRTVDYESEGFYFSEDTWHYGGWISDYWTHEKDEKWTWVKVTKDDYSGFWVEQPGTTHTYNIWMHEDGIYIDRIYMTLDPNEVPSDEDWQTPLRSDQASPQRMYGIQLDAKKNNINKYSYPIGTEVGCYDAVKYAALQEKISAADALTTGENFDVAEGNNALAEIDTAYQNFVSSLKLTEGDTTYLFHRDFEHDTAGELFPYGMNSYTMSGSGSYEIVTEEGATFLRLSTGASAGSAQMNIPYTVSGLAGSERLIVEFSARANKMLVDATTWVAMSSGNPTVTTMLYNKSASGADVMLKSATATDTVGTVAMGEWHNYKIILNMVTKTYDVYMDGTSVATGYSFRDTSVSDLIGHRFGINNKTNTSVDFDNFKVSIDKQLSSEAIQFLNDLQAKEDNINKYSYPIGTEVGCYASDKYEALQTTIAEAKALTNEDPFDVTAGNEALAKVDTAYEAFLASLKLTEGDITYLFYRDFEYDTAGTLFPYGMTSYALSGSGAYEIVTEGEEQFLRLRTGESTGSAQMSVPYAVSGLTENDRLIVEFSSRINKMSIDANAWVAMSSDKPTVTTMLYNKSASGADVILKNATGTPDDFGDVKLNDWHDFKIVLNMATKTYDLYMDGNLLTANYSFREKTVSELIGHRFGINNKANTIVDFDNFRIAVSQISESIKTEFASDLQAKKTEINSYSYPIGVGIGDYSQTAYDALQEKLGVADQLATKTVLLQYDAARALADVDASYRAFTESQMLADDGKEYLFYRDFEGDTKGTLMPYGLEKYSITGGGTFEIEEERSGNKFLRLKTVATGVSQMSIPYEVSDLPESQRLVVEFSARVGQLAKDANVWVAMDAKTSNQTVTTMLYDGSTLYTKFNGSQSQSLGTYKKTTWYNYKIVVNMKNHTYDVYIDGREEPAVTGYSFRDTALNVSSLSGHRFGINGRANTTIDFDNFKVSISEVDNLKYSLKTSHINIRDPFVLTHDGKYYMYGTRVGDTTGFDVYVSEDMENWSTAKTVFKQTEEFWGKQDFWAPEVHEHNGKFYMLATFKGETGCRGTAILVSDTPDGIFVEHSAGALTPAEWECLDGTLYFEGEIPYMVFCHEWTQIGDGAVYAVQLTADLSATVGEPFKLWNASQASWAYNLKDAGYEEAVFDKNYVTDGPNLIVVDGELVALWSSFTENGYVVAVSRSSNGSITGNWTIDDELLYDEDGGHGMIFETLEGQTKFVYHTPNTDRLERPCFKDLDLSDLLK